MKHRFDAGKITDTEFRQEFEKIKSSTFKTMSDADPRVQNLLGSTQLFIRPDDSELIRPLHQLRVRRHDVVDDISNPYEVMMTTLGYYFVRACQGPKQSPTTISP